MRYRLRTLLVLLAIVPPLLGYFWPRPPAPIPIATVTEGETARVDLIQVHTNPDFTQVIFWSRYPDGEFHVREWSLHGSMIPEKKMQITHVGVEDCDCTWSSKSGIQRRVLAPRFLETRSPRDPEMDDRIKLAKTKRIPLWESDSANRAY
jgi:hypothetical protein